MCCKIAPCSCEKRLGFDTLPIPLGPLALGATATPSKDLKFSTRRINRTLQGCGAIGLAKMFVQVFV